MFYVQVSKLFKPGVCNTGIKDSQANDGNRRLKMCTSEPTYAYVDSRRFSTRTSVDVDFGYVYVGGRRARTSIFNAQND